MGLILYFLKLDYSLSSWFSKKNKKVSKDGASLFFLNKVSFLIASVFFIIIPILPLKFKIEYVIISLMLIVAFIVYGFPKRINELIEKYNLSQDYKKSSNNTRKLRSIMSLTYMLLFFILMCFIAVVFFEGYDTRKY